MDAPFLLDRLCAIIFHATELSRAEAQSRGGMLVGRAGSYRPICALSAEWALSIA